MEKDGRERVGTLRPRPADKVAWVVHGCMIVT